MEASMSLRARRELLNRIRERYHQSDRKQKSKILDEFVEATGYGRKHAIALLQSDPTTTDKPKGKGRQRKYGEDVQQALIHVWRIANEICSKRLVPFLPDIVEALDRTGQLRLPEDVKKKLLSLSADTADRLLANERKSDNRGRSTTRPGKLLKRQIPIRTFTDWNDVVPGFFEADLVAHCGTNASGQFLNSLVITDIATAWTECFALLRRCEYEVVAALNVAQELLPVPILGLDSDNGSEFINNGLIDFCDASKITFTRSRAYKKNDQAHIEEKNGSVVRRTVGYDRYEGEAAKESLQQLYNVLRLYVNFFQPSMKLVSKHRDGAKVSRRYDKAQTPYRRMLGSSTVSNETKNHLQKTYGKLDPVLLLAKLGALQDAFWMHAWKDEAISPAQSQPKHKHIPVIETMGFDRGTAVASKTRRYRRTRKPRVPHTWRTRRDPFEGFTDLVKQSFDNNPKITATQLLTILEQKSPGTISKAQRRTLMRRLNKLRNSGDGPPIPPPKRQTYPKHRKPKTKEEMMTPSLVS
jgi:hypothetical protein